MILSCAEFKIEGGNSGIQYRSFEKPEAWGKWVIGGYQADFDAENQWTGILYEERQRGILATPGEKTSIGGDHKPKVLDRVAEKDAIKRAVRSGDWNEYHVTARGYHFIHEINGQVTADVTDNDPAMRRRSGLLALQLHAGFDMKVQFRNIRLKRLPMEACRKVVFVAGPRSHGYAEHEHNAGSLLLARALNESNAGVCATVYRDGWPADPTAFDNANAIVLYCDGGENHLFAKHLEEVDQLAKRGVGLACIHYATEVVKGDPGEAMLRWIGGCFEVFWSVNPQWMADFKQLPDHPITRGVTPFSINDEWYYHMRFVPDMKGVTPILAAIPPEETRQGKDGPRSGNPAVRERSGKPEIVAWAYDRGAAGGKGRGFGFTGGHFHWNWGNDSQRTIVLNAIAWVAGAEVPHEGISSKTPKFDELEANQDEKPPPNFNPEPIREKLRSWSAEQSATGASR